MASETTPILGERKTFLPFRSFNRNHSRRIETIRCCLCTILIAAILAILLTTIFYTGKNSSYVAPPSIKGYAAELSSIYNLTWPIEDEEESFLQKPTPNRSEVENAVNSGLKSMAQLESYQYGLPKMQIDSPSYRHQLSMKTSEKARTLMKYGLIQDMITRELAKSLISDRDECKSRVLGKWDFSDANWLPQEICVAESLTCVSTSYRTVDGTCNNLINPRSWGVAMKPFRRVLPPDYSDGVSQPRKSPKGYLPSAREVSLKVHRHIYKKDLDFTVMLAVWGQFVDHDMTATALSQGEDGQPITCCNPGGDRHPECFPVPIRYGDPFYDKFNISCMEFVRSAPVPRCRFGPREQFNQASSFIDGSAIYGNNERMMDNLRTFAKGELKMLRSPAGEELLPVSTDANDGCNREEEFKRGRYCFLSGDLRSNENLHLTTMHLIFARQHNLLARKLSVLNEHWSDEKVFQEARKILVAQIQHITYMEFLPAVLPRDLMDLLNLTVQSEGYFTLYNATVNPTIANSFAASTFRFGHSLLPGLLKMIAQDSNSEENMVLHKMLFNPFSLYDKDFLEMLIRGALNTSIEKSDVYFTREVTENLFKDGGKDGHCGLDLVSLNIQRGRDHGLPGYPRWRNHCGLKEVKSFSDLQGIFDDDSLNVVRTLYDSVDSIDLFTGGLAEIPVEGSLLGPTFTCLLADQFLRLKIGDRYWYETQEKPQAFTSDQLQEIRKTSLARIICDNSDIGEAQPLVMRRINENNRRKSCKKIPVPILDTWKELLGRQ